MPSPLQNLRPRDGTILKKDGQFYRLTRVGQVSLDANAFSSARFGPANLNAWEDITTTTVSPSIVVPAKKLWEPVFGTSFNQNGYLRTLKNGSNQGVFNSLNMSSFGGDQVTLDNHTDAPENPNTSRGRFRTSRYADGPTQKSWALAFTLSGYTSDAADRIIFNWGSGVDGGYPYGSDLGAIFIRAGRVRVGKIRYSGSNTYCYYVSNAGTDIGPATGTLNFIIANTPTGVKAYCNGVGATAAGWLTYGSAALGYYVGHSCGWGAPWPVCDLAAFKSCLGTLSNVAYYADLDTAPVEPPQVTTHEYFMYSKADTDGASAGLWDKYTAVPASGGDGTIYIGQDSNNLRHLLTDTQQRAFEFPVKCSRFVVGQFVPNVDEGYQYAVVAEPSAGSMYARTQAPRFLGAGSTYLQAGNGEVQIPLQMSAFARWGKQLPVVGGMFPLKLNATHRSWEQLSGVAPIGFAFDIDNDIPAMSTGEVVLLKYSTGAGLFEIVANLTMETVWVRYNGINHPARPNHGYISVVYREQLDFTTGQLTAACYINGNKVTNIVFNRAIGQKVEGTITLGLTNYMKLNWFKLASVSPRLIGEVPPQ